MSAWDSLQSGDKQSLFDQFSPKLQNWENGKPAWEEIDKNLKNYESDWTQSKLDDLNITLIDSYGRGPDGTETKTGLQNSVDKDIAVYYPKATQQYVVLYEFKTGNHFMGKSCTFYKLDSKWYLHHIFL